MSNSLRPCVSSIRSLHREYLLYRFPNGWGAAIYKHCGCFGTAMPTWNLVPLKYLNLNESESFYTPEVPDVVEHLSVDSVNNYLDKISEYPTNPFYNPR